MMDIDKYLCRGKTPPTEEYLNDGLWAVGYYTCFNGVEHRIYSGYAETDCGDYYPDWDNVIPETVGRYTGLTDKHYEMVFEGDIIKVAIWREIGCYPHSETRIIEVKIPNIYWADIDGDIEIIGNIYDNPELLNN